MLHKIRLVCQESIPANQRNSSQVFGTCFQSQIPPPAFLTFLQARLIRLIFAARNAPAAKREKYMPFTSTCAL